LITLPYEPTPEMDAGKISPPARFGFASGGENWGGCQSAGHDRDDFRPVTRPEKT
jgi:hypothetical protein